MAGGLVGLLDDVAALAKLAAASIDDVGAAAGRASLKAAGVVVDDAAVTPGYVQGLAAERELPIIRRIATGSVRNKLVFILPVALLLSEVAPTLVEVILLFGGAFLSYEGAHKVVHAVRHRGSAHGGDGHGTGPGGDVPAVALGPDAEAATVSGAIRTDFILSAEIMVISLKEVLHEPLVHRAAILVVVAVLITLAVYGVVAGIVKLDNVGLALTRRGTPRAERVGRALVRAMPVLLRWLSTVGIAAMLWVGGHILLVGADELGWHAPYGLVHDLESTVHGGGVAGAVVRWVLATGAAAVVGVGVGLTVNAVLGVVRRPPAPAGPAA